MAPPSSSSALRPLDVQAFAQTQLSLLAAELAAETEEAEALAAGRTSPAALQRAGVALVGLVVGAQRTGLGARTVLELVPDAATAAPKTTGGGGGAAGKAAAGKAAKTSSSSSSSGAAAGGARDADPELPEHGLRSGDIVLLAQMPAGGARKREAKEMERRGARAVVTRVQRTSISVALDSGGGGDGGGGKGGGGGGGGGAAAAAPAKDEDDLPLTGRLWMVKLADDVTYRRMNQAMQRLAEMSEAAYTPFVRVAFGLSHPTPLPADPSSDPAVGRVEWVDPSLNESQREAVRFALAAREVALIHGPPGTGKTHTLVELVLQLLKRGKRVLVCGPSNISVDNLVERIARYRGGGGSSSSSSSGGPAPAQVPRFSLVRLGHPARLLPSVVAHSLDVLTQTSEAGALVADVRRDMDARRAAVSKTRSGAERRQIWAELRDLRREFRERERRCVDGLVAGSAVVLATLHGAGGNRLGGGGGAHHQQPQQFDVVVIDEASQALEAQCWVPLLLPGASAAKVVFAGDHLQLPPTVKSANSKEKEKKKKKSAAAGKADKRADKGEADKAAGPESSVPAGDGPAMSGLSLETTLFDRLLAMHGGGIKRMLTTQYRMHERIMRFPSDELYDGRLVAGDGVGARLLKDLYQSGGGGGGGTSSASTSKDGRGVAATDDTTEPLIFIDTQGGDFPERSEEEDAGDAGGGAAPKKKTSLRGLLAESKSNDGEAALVRRHVRALVEAGVRPEDIAVVTPYNAQLALLAPLKDAYPGIELGSVDGFQGREKEAVVLSLVRSNPDGDVGFLADKRRLNVAMTRPKRSLTVIGDSETVKKGGSFLKRWMEFLEENADLRYPDLSSLSLED